MRYLHQHLILIYVILCIFYVYLTCVCWILVLVVVVLLHWCHGLREYRWQHAGPDHGWGERVCRLHQISHDSQRLLFRKSPCKRSLFSFFFPTRGIIFHLLTILSTARFLHCTWTQIPSRQGKSCWRGRLCLCIMPAACSKEGRDVERFWGRMTDFEALGHVLGGNRLPHYRSANEFKRQNKYNMINMTMINMTMINMQYCVQ